jgi:hypothetical protein
MRLKTQAPLCPPTLKAALTAYSKSPDLAVDARASPQSGAAAEKFTVGGTVRL